MTYEALKRKRVKLYGCFVDFEKAYDRVSRKALFYKLQRNGLSGGMIQRIQEIYKRVEFCIKVGGDEITSGVESRIGLRQGCQLSPILFSLYINDIEDALKLVETHPPNVSGEPVPVLLYADDLIMLSQTQIGIQRALNVLN